MDDLTLLRTWVVLTWTFAGWSIGFVLSPVVYRLPRELPWNAEPACPACGVRVRKPGLGLTARCHLCRAWTGFDRVEWPLAALYLLMILRFPPPAIAEAFIYSLFAIALLVIAMIDLRHRFVYLAVSLPSLLGALVLSPWVPGLSITRTLLGFAIGTAVFLGFYVVGRLAYRGAEPMGTGDITIAAIIGAMVGFPRVISALFIGVVASAVIGLVMMLVTRGDRRAFFPYGPGLCLGALVSFFMPV